MNELFRALNRIKPASSPVWGSPEWWAEQMAAGRRAFTNPSIDLREFDGEAEKEMEGDSGREWWEVKRDNEGR